MGSGDIQKRITLLKKKVDSDKAGRVKFFRAFILSFIGLWIVISILPKASPEKNVAQSVRSIVDDDPATARLLQRLYGSSRNDNARSSGSSRLRNLKARVEAQVIERAAWLKKLPFRSGAGDTYLTFSRAIIDSFLPEIETRGQLEDVIDFNNYYETAYISLTNVLLRLGFIVVGFWPFWTVAFILGGFALPRWLRPKRTIDLLGVCDRGTGPFYSGIYGPLRPNNSMSATDFSCPGLACPEMATPAVAMAHPLANLLKRASALNETNLGLLRVILAYRDFPSFVEEERNSEEVGEETAINEAPALTRAKTITSDGRPLEVATREGLTAILEAHRAIQSLHQDKKNPKSAPQPGEEFYKQYLADLKRLSEKLSPVAQTLLFSLTAARCQALAKLPIALIATAYLATEAGKSLVFRRLDRGFTQISRFPHLQARAVLQSEPNYHREYNGDARLVARQAIVASRRHGDFGRAFLPINMPIASRALRDWLEILYAHPKRREDSANLAELDAHLEEIHFNFRGKLAERLKFDQQERAKHIGELPAAGYSFWKGVPYRSAVLVPLGSVVETALNGLSDSRRERISELIRATRKLQSSLSISARLPGFKRQAVEAEQTTVASEGFGEIFNSSDSGKALLEKWFIIRRTLTRYNWLSTRVGDYNVPVDGLIHSVVIDRTVMPVEVVGLDTLVPLRQRRLKEVFGVNWERTYYSDAPHPNDLSVFVDSKEFRDGFQRKREDAKRGLFDGGPRANDTINSAVG